MYNAIDLYSGIGGWTLGMKLSSINNVMSYEWWKEANSTHNINFGTNHNEVDIRKIDIQNDLNFKDKIHFVVGSPPCTQFSYANRGGNGDINDGLIDIRKFLEIVDFLKPTYWAMENVPRVAKILEKELETGSLKKFKHLVRVIEIVDSADFGVPQNRKRMIAGNFPFDLFNSYKTKCDEIHLSKVIADLNSASVIDTNYGYKFDRSEITELENEPNLSREETRINHDSKAYHPIYNNMYFPEKLDRPCRTITATCTRVSRESIIIDSNDGGYRRLNVRERGVVQGFPITYQFYGRTLNAKFKMIGNAVPPILTYYIFQSMLGTQLQDLKKPSESIYYHEKPSFNAYPSKLELPKRKYSKARKFMFAVPNLRYGSGVRFELSNDPKTEYNKWLFKFYFGNSKKIKSIELNSDVRKTLAPILNTTKNHLFDDKLDDLLNKYYQLNSERLQELWTSSSQSGEVFNFLDDVGNSIKDIMDKCDLQQASPELLEAIVNEKNNKLSSNSKSVLAGLYFLSKLNEKILYK